MQQEIAGMNMLIATNTKINRPQVYFSTRIDDVLAGDLCTKMSCMLVLSDWAKYAGIHAIPSLKHSVRKKGGGQHTIWPG